MKDMHWSGCRTVILGAIQHAINHSPVADLLFHLHWTSSFLFSKQMFWKWNPLD